MTSAWMLSEPYIINTALDALKNSDVIRDIDYIKQLQKYLLKISLVHVFLPLLCYFMIISLFLPFQVQSAEANQR